MRRTFLLALVALVAFVALVTAVTGAGATTDPDGPEIALALSLYVVTSDDELRSSTRTPAELHDIAERMNEIWAPAGIVFEPVRVDEVVVAEGVLAAVAAGDAAPFLERLGGEIRVPEPGVVNGFYVADAGGPNGFNPSGSTLFVVDDDPSVPDERVSSHEVGHILGLHHVLGDPDRLMFSGTQGIQLSPTERAVARYVVEGILEGVR